ncbi:MAG: 2-amino-4-hydroxy-6-hydroxymethyldihydropteridine diphosphokinase [Candidatus Kapaibacteriales bacterium]
MSFISENKYGKFVLLSVGSNIGDRSANIEDAYEHLIVTGTLSEARISSFYETEPVGITEQAWFLNAAIAGYTILSPLELLKTIKDIEYSCGREKRKRWHERELDIDLLLHSDTILETSHITLPHCRMHKRRFVLVPSAEIAPDAFHPKLLSTVSQLLDECPDQSEIKIY